MSSMVSRSMVLGNDGLLGDILLRVDSPATLVRAAMVSRRWLRGASFPPFLRRFRELHPPGLLGIYVTGDGLARPEFVPVLTPQPVDLTAAASGANLSFGAGLADYSSAVWDVRDGRVLYECAPAFHLPRGLVVRAPLRYPGQDFAVLPPPPLVLPGCPHAVLLVPDGDDQSRGATCYRVDVGVWDCVVFAKVYALKPMNGDGEEEQEEEEWGLHCSVAARLGARPVRFLDTTLLAGGKVYMVAAGGFVVGLDLAAKMFFVLELPGGVTCELDGGNVVLCRGDGDALCLVHVDGDNLRVWVRGTDDGHIGGEWVLKDTVSVKETCADLLTQDEEQQQGPEQQADGEEVGPELEDGNAAEEVVGPEAEDGDEAPAEEVGPELADGDVAADVEPEPADGDDGPPGEEVPPEQEAEGGGAAIYYVVGAGDNAEFVFLELDDSGVIVYLHLGSKQVEKVYQRDPDDDNAIRVHPFMMVWPPTFPALRGDEAEEE